MKKWIPLEHSASRGEDPQVDQDIPPGTIRAHVSKVLASKEFVHADSLRRFLAYSVEKTIEGETSCLKESLLGTTLFGRGDAFDPRIDPIVRVQAGKLRTRLQRYYEEDGHSDPLIIEFPKGAYVPSFHVRKDEAPAPPVPRRLGTFRWVVLALSILGAASAVLLWQTRPPAPTPPTFTRLTFTTDATSAFPSISREGKLVVFASDRGGRGSLELFAQVIGGEGPVQLTHSGSKNRQTDISPDGTRVVFLSDRDGAGLYTLSLLSHVETKIAGLGFNPRFSPDGSRIAYEGQHGKLYTVGVMGGPAQALDSATVSATYPLWTPDGKHLLAAVRNGDADFDWMVFPLEGGIASSTGARNVFRRQQLGNSTYPPVPGDWLGDRVVFSAGEKESASLWEIPLSTKTFRVTGPARRLTSGPGAHTYPRLASLGATRARIVFVNENIVPQISSFIPNPDQDTPLLDHLTQDSSLVPEGSPQLSADGSKLAFCSTRLGNRDIWIKDLRSGVETAVAANPWPEERPLISPDGLLVAYVSYQTGHGPAIQLWDSAGGSTRKVCDDCGRPIEWLPDNKQLLIAADSPARLQIWNAGTGESRTLLPDLQTPVAEAVASPDGRWLAVTTTKAAEGCPASFLAPVTESHQSCKDWTALPTTGSIWGLRWSQQGDLLYFFSSRDGTRCIWGQRVSLPDYRPVGKQFAVQHFHRYQPIPRSDSGISVTNGHLAVWFQDSQSSIWMAEVHN